MRYHALACDYDGTIAWDGQVNDETIHALEEVRKSGRKLILVTGRELDDLQRVFSRFDLFDRIVAENGALLYRPHTKEEKVLAEPAPPEFVERLRARGVDRISVGRSIVATWTPHETTAVQVIKELGLELHVIFNKGAVMILPSGVNKATGLSVALDELDLSPHNVVGVGDAENDHAFLALCECSVAVANALPMLKEKVDWVAPAGHGDGVQQLIAQLVSSDLAEVDGMRHRLVLGQLENGDNVSVKPYGTNILITGSSGSGKSTLALAFTEALVERQYQFLIIDPEGDYSSFENAIVLGDEQRPPNLVEVTDVIARPHSNNVVVNLVGLALKERPVFFEALFTRLQEIRTKAGRPHWILIDEAHHVLPASWDKAEFTLSPRIYGVMMITLEPDRLSPTVRSLADLVIAIGDNASDMFGNFILNMNAPAPVNVAGEPGTGEALAWLWRSKQPPFLFRATHPQSQRRRHRRKYAEGELKPEQSFYFKGPENKLNLRAHNLTVFLQLAEGVDDDTWLFHLRNDEIAGWFRDVIKDPELAAEADRMKNDQHLDARESRAHIKDEIEKRYILAA